MPPNLVEDAVLTRNSRIIDVILFKKMCDVCGAALRINVTNPIEIHDSPLALTCTFTASDYPVDSIEIGAKIKLLQQRLGRNKPDCCWYRK